MVHFGFCAVAVSAGVSGDDGEICIIILAVHIYINACRLSSNNNNNNNMT